MPRSRLPAPRSRPAPAGPPPRPASTLTPTRPAQTPTYLTRFHDIKLAVSTAPTTHTHPGDALTIHLHLSHTASIHTVLASSAVSLHSEVARRKKNNSYEPGAPGANAQALTRAVALSFPPRAIPSRAALVCGSGRLTVASGPRLAPFVYSAAPLLPPVPAAPGPVLVDTAPEADAPYSMETGRRHRVLTFDAVVPDDAPESVSFVEDAKRDARVDIRLRLYAVVEVQILQRTVAGLQPRSIRIIAENVIKVLPPCTPRPTFPYAPHLPGAIMRGGETSYASARLAQAQSDSEMAAAALEPASFASAEEMYHRAAEEEPADMGRSVASFASLAMFRRVARLHHQRSEDVQSNEGDDHEQARYVRTSTHTSSGPASHSGALSGLSVTSGGEDDDVQVRRSRLGTGLKSRNGGRGGLQKRRAGVLSIPVRGGGLVSIEMLPQDGGVGKVGEPFRVTVRVVCDVAPRHRLSDGREGEAFSCGGSGSFASLFAVRSDEHGEYNAGLRDSAGDDGGFATLRDEDEEDPGVSGESTGMRSVRLSSALSLADNRLRINATLEQHVKFAVKRPRCLRRVTATGLVRVPVTAGDVTEMTLTLRPTRRAAFYATLASGPLTITHTLTTSARASFGAQRSADTRIRLTPGIADGSAYAAQNARPTPRWAGAYERRLARAVRGSVRAFAIPVLARSGRGGAAEGVSEEGHRVVPPETEAGNACNHGERECDADDEELKVEESCSRSQHASSGPGSGNDACGKDCEDIGTVPFAGTGDDMCPICLDDASCAEDGDDGSEMVRLPACGHVGHVECLDSWLSRRRVCPVCVAEVKFPKTPGSCKSGSDGGASCCAEHVYLAPVLRRVYC